MRNRLETASDHVATITPMAKSSNSGAARFTTRYTDDQKQAILRAVLIDGHTVAQAIVMAGVGELGVPAFAIGVYAYDVVKKGRDAFEAEHDDALTAAIEHELKGAEIDALATIRAIRKGFKPGLANDITRLAMATRDLAAIRKARTDTLKAKREPQQHAKPQSSTSEAVSTTPRDTTLTNLLDLASPAKAAGAKSGSLPRAQNPDPSSRLSA